MKKRLLKHLFLVGLAFFWLAPLVAFTDSESKTDDNFGNYYAIVIGIDEYKGSVWNPLGNAVNDAKAFEELFKSKYGFKEVWTLYDKDATRANILQDISNISKKLTEKDNLLIYYSGHGIEISGEGYWVPADAKTEGIYALISNNDIKNIVSSCKSQHTLVMVDACFSGTLFKAPNSVPLENNGTETYYEKINKLVSRQAITSGGLEPVPDSKGNICKGKHSVFACYTLEALEENENPYLEAAELFSKIKFPVQRNATLPRFGYLEGVGDEGGQFIFRLKNTLPVLPVLPVLPNEDGDSKNKNLIPQGTYGIATGSASGTYIVFGQDIKRVSEGKVPLSVIETKGSLDNFNRLLDGNNNVQFAIVQYDVLQSEDRSGFLRKNKSEDIKMVFPLYGEEIHILTKKNSGITTFNDLRDKKVVVGVEGSGTWISMKNLLKKTGMKWNGIAKDFDEGLKDVMAEKADAVVYVAGSPTKKLGKLSTGASNFIQLVSIPPSEEISEIYEPTLIKAKTYDWLTSDVSTYSIKSILVSYDYEKGTKEYQAIIDLVDTILGKMSDLKELGHPKWENVCPLDYTKVPWDMHPAAKETIDVWQELMGNSACE